MYKVLLAVVALLLAVLVQARPRSHSHHGTRLLHGPTNVPLSCFYVENLGFVSDSSADPKSLFHDGGGGATQNGYHVQVFADSGTTSNGFNFVHNSIAYFGLQDPLNPLDQYTFGMTGDPGNKTFVAPFIGPQGNETAMGSDFSVWALGSMAPMHDGTTIVGVFPCLDESTSTLLYNTMVQIEVVDPALLTIAGGFPPTKRLGSGRLFYAGEVQYGTFANTAGIDGYFYLMGSDGTGVKLARTPDTPARIADRKHYEYWNNATLEWQIQPLKEDDPSGNILTWSINPFGTQVGPFCAGDVWYDAYHQTTMMLYMDAFIDGQFWISYATTNSITGPWSEPVAIWTSPVPAECRDQKWNYAGHAHPGHDPTGKTLMLSYSSCETYVSMALLTWD